MKYCSVVIALWLGMVCNGYTQEFYGFTRLNPSSNSWEDGVNVIPLNDSTFGCLHHSRSYNGGVILYKNYIISATTLHPIDSIIVGADSSMPQYGGRGNAIIDASGKHLYAVVTNLSGEQYDNVSAAVIKYSIVNSDTVYYKKYIQDSLNAFNQIRETADGNLILSGTEDIDPAPWQNMSLTKIDPNGNILWQKEYGSDESDKGNSVAIARDGSLYLLGESRGYGPNQPNYSDALLIKTDSLGNELWRTHWGGYYGDCAWNVEPTQDGGVVVCGCVASDNSQDGDGVSYGYVRKMDESGLLLWDYKYPVTTLDEGGRPVVFNMCKVLPDNGNIIAAGWGYTWQADSLTDRSTPWVIMLDSTGNLIMSRSYSSILGDKTGAIFQDIRPTPDGGFIAGGTYYPKEGDTGNQDAFILKLDEHGCEYPECHPPIGVEEVVYGDEGFIVYPNPTKDQMTVQLKSPVRSWSLLTLDGRPVIHGGNADQHFDVDLSHLASGMYILSVIGQQGSHAQRVVKE